jgi:hypothetical protein
MPAMCKVLEEIDAGDPEAVCSSGLEVDIVPFVVLWRSGGEVKNKG